MNIMGYFYGILIIFSLSVALASVIHNNRKKIGKAEKYLQDKYKEGKIPLEEGNRLLEIFESNIRIHAANEDASKTYTKGADERKYGRQDAFQQQTTQHQTTQQTAQQQTQEQTIQQRVSQSETAQRTADTQYSRVLDGSETPQSQSTNGSGPESQPARNNEEKKINDSNIVTSFEEKDINGADTGILRSHEEKKINGANILLILGVAFILVAGLIFATTTWNYLDNIVRTTIVLATSFVFFMAYVFAERKLKLHKTSIAFYCLGSIFLPITVFTAGYFRLLGDYVSLHGGGEKLLWAIVFAPVLLTAAYATKKFLFNFFAWITLASVTLLTGFLLRQFLAGNDLFMLALTIYSAMVLVFVGIIKKKITAKSDFAKLVFANLSLFAILNTSIIGVASIIFSSTSIISFGTTLLLAGLLLSRTFNSNSNSYGAYIFSFIMLFGFSRINVGTGFDNRILLLAFCSSIIYLLGYLGFFSQSVKKALNIGALALIGITYLTNLGYFLFQREITVMTLVSMLILLANIVVISLVTKSKISIAIIPFILLSIINALSSLVRPENFNEGIFYSLGILAAFLLLYLIDFAKISIKFNSRFSEVLFASGSLYWCLKCLLYNDVVNNEFGALAAYLILIVMIILVIIDSRDKLSSIVACYVLPLAALLFIPVFNNFIHPPYLTVLVLYGGIFLASLVCLFLSRKNEQFKNLDRAFLAGHFVFVIYFSVLCFRDSAFLVSVIFVLYFLARLIQKNETANALGLQLDIKKIYIWLIGIGSTSAVMLFLYEKIPGLNLFYTLASSMTVPFIATVLFIIFSKTKSGRVEKYLNTISTYFLVMSNLAFIYIAMNYFSGTNALTYRSIVMSIIVLYCIAVPYYLKKPVIAVFGILPLYPLMFKHAGLYFAEKPMYIFISTLVMFALFLVISKLTKMLKKDKEQFDTETLKNDKEQFGTETLKNDIEQSDTQALKNDKNLFDIDWFKLVNIIAPIYILTSLPTYYEIGGFALLATYILLFYRKENSRILNDSIITFGSFFFCTAFWSQKFVVLPYQFETLINIVPISIYVFLIYKFLWRDIKWITNRIALLYSVIVVLILSIESMKYSYLYNALIIGVSALLGLVISYIYRQKGWFAFSVITLIGLSIYMTRSFWASLAWWVYLLSVGIILIAIAATNEIIKKKKVQNEFKPLNIFKDWNW